MLVLRAPVGGREKGGKQALFDALCTAGGVSLRARAPASTPPLRAVVEWRLGKPTPARAAGD